MYLLRSTTSHIRSAPTVKMVALHKPANRRHRIAYLTAEYPKVSHTFIRREIRELERQGHEIVRLSVRPPSAPLADAADIAEAGRTLTCLTAGKGRLLSHLARAAVFQPASFVSAARTAMRLHRASDRGLIRHTAYLAEAAFLAKRLHAEGITHTHVHFGTNAAAVALLMKKLAGITYSMTVHGPGEFDAPIGLSLREKVAESAFTNAISNFGKAQLCRWVAPQHWDRIHVVRCTVAPEFLDEPPAFDTESRRLLCIGRLTPQKGQLLLVEAFARTVRAGGVGHLVFAGDGELRQAIETRVRELGIGSRVTITGWVCEAQIRELIRRSRAVVLPSAAEGLPVALMEAFALARPVVSTFTAGIPELVQSGQSGWLVPAGDVATLTAALQEVLSAPAARLADMGLVGRSRVLRNHHPAIEGHKLESLFSTYLQ
ncbi:MAG: glycosyltransferase family 4 protein [Gemmataceae bacterium]